MKKMMKLVEIRIIKIKRIMTGWKRNIEGKRKSS